MLPMYPPDIFPPVVCRLMARHPDLTAKQQKPLTDEEIAEASGLRVDQVKAISMLYDWEHIPSEVMFRFAFACGIDFRSRDNIRKHMNFSRKVKWLSGSHFLKRDKDWASRWRPMIVSYLEHLKSNG